MDPLLHDFYVARPDAMPKHCHACCTVVQPYFGVISTGCYSCVLFPDCRMHAEMLLTQATQNHAEFRLLTNLCKPVDDLTGVKGPVNVFEWILILQEEAILRYRSG